MDGPSTFSLSAPVLAKLGVPFEKLCERAGVPASRVLSTSDFFRLWEAAEELFGDRFAGLRFGAAAIDSGYGVAAIVAMHAPNFREALAALARYKRLTCPELVEIESDGDEVTVRYRWLQATSEVPRLLVDMTMASLRELARRGTAERAAPIRLELSRRAVDRDHLECHFGCAIVFGAPHDAMVFDRAALNLPFVTADGGAFALLLSGLEKRIGQGEGFSPFVGEVRVTIARQLSEGRRPSIAAVARRLGASSRTLQRRLDACETSFQQQLAGVRRTVANRLLANTEMDTVAIAMLLGFVEPNSFARAFRIWERTTPSRWRERQTATRANQIRNLQS
jgi:AraC-like DNA-binding protein